ncbi:MAG: DNA translocase SpoIIIE [Eubacteriales bacterium SKADARSKE-1]|nr:DNA translocase SpoIIIE [Eubacteriales bacterium SKADARSKE-1]
MVPKNSTLPKKTKSNKRKTVPPKNIHIEKRGYSNKVTAKSMEVTKSRNQAAAILIFALALFLACIVLIKGENLWTLLHQFILGLFGTSAILWPILLLYVSITTALEKPSLKVSRKVMYAVSVILLFGTTVYIFGNESKTITGNYFQSLTTLYKNGVNNKGAGFFSGIIGIPSVLAFGAIGAKIVIFLLLFISVMFLTGTGLIQLFRAFAKPASVVKDNLSQVNENKQKSRSLTNIDIDLGNDRLPSYSDNFDNTLDTSQAGRAKLNKLKAASLTMNIEEDSALAAATTFVERNKAQNSFVQENSVAEIRMDGQYKYPNEILLDKSLEQNSADIAKELQANGKMLVDTLENFAVRTKIVDISRGPAVTRYELQPAAGIKISKITNLADDIALNLAASGVRIEAPIPGKAAVGIEIPNKIVNIVKMRELIVSDEFIKSKGKLTVILGRDIAGKVKVADLAKMPHLLIAGSTGSGKSVCINSFIMSLLYKATPNEVKLLMVDPKVVELGIYNGIPHLLVPVVTDPRKAAGVLNWAVTEMLKRYKIFAENNVRDLTAYNNMVRSKTFKKDNISGEEIKTLPQIVIIIDELADLMMVAPNEVEDAICRLAQMARAAGMHLVIATQRPSVDVITGTIKANIPSRIALAVSSQIDSRTILDSSGAEKLLGRGDMLFSPIGVQKPIRVQGCFVTDKEIESVIDFIKNSNTNEYDQDVIEEIEKNAVLDDKEKKRGFDDEDNDPLLHEAIQCVVELGQASTSLLQRKLRLGYARAGRIIDQMEQRGIVGPHEGSRPRQVLISHQRWLEMNNSDFE